LLESLGTPGHDGIRAPGSQSMTAASRARVVIGCPGAGPTYFTGTLVASCSSSVSSSIRWVAKVSGGPRHQSERPLVFPDCPHNASELVRHRDSGLVVDVGLRQLVRPFPQPIRLLLSCVHEH